MQIKNLLRTRSILLEILNYKSKVGWIISQPTFLFLEYLLLLVALAPFHAKRAMVVPR